MALKSHEARKLAMASVAALALLGGASSSAQAAITTITYQCTYPLIGAQPLSVEVDANIPATAEIGVPTPPIEVKVRAVAGGNTYAGISLIGAKTIEGAASSRTRIVAPGFDVDVAVPVNLDPFTVPSTPGDLTLFASGTSPSVTFSETGTATVTLESIALNLIARNAAGVPIALPPVTVDSDGNPDTFDVACVLTPPSQSTVIGTIAIMPPFDPPPTPTSTPTPSPTPVPPPSPTVTPTPSPTPVPPPSPTVTPVTPVPTPVLPVKPFVLSLSPTHGPAAGGNELVIATSTYNAPTKTVTVGGKPATILSRTSDGQGSEAGVRETSVTVTVPAGTAGTTVDVILNNAGFGPLTGDSLPTEKSKYTYDAESSDTVDYGYGLSGAATLKTLTKGSIPLAGSIAAKLKLATGDFTADLKLNPTTAKLTTLGFLPITAKVEFVSTAPTTGTLTGGVLSSNSKVRIKLPEVTLFGVRLAGGANCQTKTASNIALKSTGGAFNPLAGGNLAGTFAISDLTGCGFLTGLVSPLTAGKGNAIALKLTPQG